MNEVELGEHVLRWLPSQGAEQIYTEPDVDGRRPDIVAVYPDGAIEVIELKTRFAMAGVKQLEHWSDKANWRTLAIGPIKKGDVFKRAMRMLDGWAGLIEVTDGGTVTRSIASPYRMALHRHIIADSLDPLRPIAAPPGSTGIRKYSRRERTLSRLREACGIEWQPLRAVVESIRHHYTTNRRAVQLIYNHYHQHGLPWAEIRFRRGEHWIRLKPLAHDPTEGIF